VILDLTSLEKRGKFPLLNGLVRVDHGKRGLHVVVLYLVVGQWRVPWNFRVYRDKDTPSSAQLGLQLVRRLPNALTRHFEVLILVDTAFGSIELLSGARQLKYHVIAGVRRDRKLTDGRCVAHLYHRGQQVRLVGLSLPVSISWYYLKRDNGQVEKRFVLSTQPLKGTTISRWGKKRWQIEGWFKTAKHRFGLHRFGQSTLLGVYRWLLLSLLAYLLAHWAFLSMGTPGLPDWGKAAQLALESLLLQLVALLLLSDALRLRPLLQSLGIHLQFSWCKM
jgi:hypothetical protein